MTTVPEFLEWLEGTSLGAIARESLYGFQVLVAVHILGLIFSVGTLLWVDLRMMGICLNGYRLAEVYRALSRWFIGGFIIMFLSGIALFAGFATSAYENNYFRIKMLVILVAGINAIVFHALVNRMPAINDSEVASPANVRFAGFTSILLWAVVVLCGRMMSYTLF
jgi:hypothetical protein